MKMETPNIVFEGVLEKAGIFKNKTKVWAVLLGNSLTYYKNNKRSSCIGSIDMTEVHRVRQKIEAKGGVQFEICTSSKSYTFKAESAEVCSGWVSVLQTSMLHKANTRCSTGDAYDKYPGIERTEDHSLSATESRDTRVSDVYNELENLPSPTAPVFGVKLKPRRSKSRLSATSQRESKTVPGMDNHPASACLTNDMSECAPTSQEASGGDTSMTIGKIAAIDDGNTVEYSEIGTVVRGGDNTPENESADIYDLPQGMGNVVHTSSDSQREKSVNHTMSTDDEISFNIRTTNSFDHNEYDHLEYTPATSTNTNDATYDHVTLIHRSDTVDGIQPVQGTDGANIDPDPVCSTVNRSVNNEPTTDFTNHTPTGADDCDVSHVEMRNNTRRGTFIKSASEDPNMYSNVHVIEDDCVYDNIMARTHESVYMNTDLFNSDSGTDDADDGDVENGYDTADGILRQLEDTHTDSDADSAVHTDVEAETEVELKSEAYHSLLKYVSDHHPDFDIDTHKIVSDVAVYKLRYML